MNRIKKILLASAFLISPLMGSPGYEIPSETPAGNSSENHQLYRDLALEGRLTFAAFEQAMGGYRALTQAGSSIITIIDFSKPSTQERLFVLDLQNKSVLISSVVSHGKNSGELYATSFSNKSGSNKSSLGFYLTGETYDGRNGYSLRLVGLEAGINDQALNRGVVIHAANYCNPDFVTSAGRLGRSQGCPAVPEALNVLLIDTIKGGSLLYIYANDQQYSTQSTLLSSTSPGLL